MSEIEAYRERVLAARLRLRSLPLPGRGRLGPPDEKTGERWNAGNVLGHTAEMLPFWSAQVRSVAAGAAEFGRGEAGYTARRRGIEELAQLDEAALRAEIEQGIEVLLRLLDELAPADLERRVTYRSATGEREVDLRQPLEELLVGHLEAHLRQLEELSGSPPGAPPRSG